GPQPEYYRIATCPRCGYSGYDSDFAPGITLPPDVRDKILTSPRLALPEGFTPHSDPRELDASDRYDLAIQCYRWRGKSEEALAWLHLRASWIARDSGSILPPDPRLQRVLEFAERWRPTMQPTDNQADVEMRMATHITEALATGRFNRYQRPYVELALVLILRQRGENRHALPRLERLADYEPFAESLHEGIARMRDSIDRERLYQREAAQCFERALLARQISPENRGAACYLLGEILRRLGRDREAVGWYEQARQDTLLKPDLRVWAEEQRTWIVGPGRQEQH
ncbi:MAG: DUF2225 domain-containing protein, partial [Phycisphaerales bacterium]|nr:DUF2225 domain-containing protein [Phycisphaerales bacterium]